MSLKSVIDGEGLAAALGRNYRRNLLFIAYRLPAASKFRKFTIPKKSGGLRNITAPSSALVNLQRQLLGLIEPDTSFRPNVHGFVKGRSIASNADVHVGSRWILNFDIKDFFETITFARIYGRLQANPYNYSPSVATIVAHVCCNDKKLIQGGPLSPIISNIICDRLDSELVRLCGKYGARYSRYADDITISTRRHKFPSEIASLSGAPSAVSLGPELLEIVKNNGFVINDDKTRLLGRHSSQEVTGLITNEKRNVPRAFIRQIRCMIHAWERFGLADAEREHFARWRNPRGRLPDYEAKNFEWVVSGKLEFLRQIRGESDALFQKLALRFNALASIAPFKIVPVESHDVINEAVWVIEGVKYKKTPRKITRKSSWWQRLFRLSNGPEVAEEIFDITEEPYIGTVFFLKDSGIITCEHCFTDGARIYRPKSKHIGYSVQTKHADAKNDICVIESNELFPALAPKAHLKRAPDHVILSLRVGDEVQFAGFPSHLPENHVSIKTGRISRFWETTIDGTPLSRREWRFVLDANIIEGTSGGPVLYRGEVVGIAARGPGENSVMAASAVVPLTALP